jgi:hypothetical protein
MRNPVDFETQVDAFIDAYDGIPAKQRAAWRRKLVDRYADRWKVRAPKSTEAQERFMMEVVRHLIEDDELWNAIRDLMYFSVEPYMQKVRDIFNKSVEAEREHSRKKGYNFSAQHAQNFAGGSGWEAKLRHHMYMGEPEPDPFHKGDAVVYIPVYFSASRKSSGIYLADVVKIRYKRPPYRDGMELIRYKDVLKWKTPARLNDLTPNARARLMKGGGKAHLNDILGHYACGFQDQLIRRKNMIT